MKAIQTIEEEIKDLQNKFDQAQVNEDFDTIEDLISPEIMFIGPKGFITDVKEWLKVHKEGEYKQTVMQSNNADVRIFGNTAILYDLKLSECEYKGELIKGNFRVTQVWYKHDENWKLTSVQFTPVSSH